MNTIPELDIRLRFREVPAGKRKIIGAAPATLSELASLFSWMTQLPIEQLITVSLDTRGRVRNYHVVASGSANRVAAPLHEIVRPVMNSNCQALALVHNHPSGNPCPSGHDFELTRKVRRACAMLDILFHDHLIVAMDGVWSMGQRGWV